MKEKFTASIQQLIQLYCAAILTPVPILQEAMGSNAFIDMTLVRNRTLVFKYKANHLPTPSLYRIQGRSNFCKDQRINIIEIYRISLKETSCLY